MTINPVATFHSPVRGKFGLPRQAGVASSLRGELRLLPEYAREEALRGIEGFDRLWLIWEFNLNGAAAPGLTVRPPRLGGNTRVGVFASRSPFRPNPIGLSCVRLESVDYDNGVLYVSGADLADGTPVYDIKPYVTYADSYPDARCGFVDANDWHPVPAMWNPEAEMAFLRKGFSADDVRAVGELLSQDPRPRARQDSDKVYGLVYEGTDVRFKSCGDGLEVVGIV